MFLVFGLVLLVVFCILGVFILFEMVWDKVYGFNIEVSLGFSLFLLFLYIIFFGMYLYEEEVFIIELIIIFGWDKVFILEEFMYFNFFLVVFFLFRGK